MRDAIIIVVVLLLLLLLISVFGGSLRYTPSAETFYQSIDESDEQQHPNMDGGGGGGEEHQVGVHDETSMPMPQVDTFAENEEANEEPSGELSPMMMSETFQQAEKSATEVMKKILSPDKKIEPFQSGGHYATF